MSANDLYLKTEDLQGKPPVSPTKSNSGTHSEPGKPKKRGRVLIQYTAAVIMTFLTAAVTFCFALFCGEQYALYMKLVFIPFFAFAACFANTVLFGKCRLMPAVVMIICIASYFIFVRALPGALSSILLYAVNVGFGAAVGMLINSLGWSSKKN